MQSNNTRILFVDDDNSLLAGLRRILHRFRDEWEMDFCTSGREAIGLLEQNQFHVVVSDIRMPEMDGEELMRQIHCNFPGVVRIILSGQAEQSKVIELTEVAHQYFSKPCNPDKLQSKINLIRSKQQLFNCHLLVDYLTGMSSIPVLISNFKLLQTELNKSNVNLNAVVKIINTDLALSLKVLQLAGSNFFGKQTRSNRVEEACRKLGLDVLKPILLNSNTVAEHSIPAEADNLDTQADQEIVSRLHRHSLVNSTNDAVHDLASKIQFAPHLVLEYLLTLWGINSLPANLATSQNETTNPVS